MTTTRRDWPAFLRALVAPEAQPLAEWMARQPLREADVRWLWHQRLAAYFYHRLREQDALDRLPPDVRERLVSPVRWLAVEDALHFEELQLTLGALDAAGVPCLLMKGAALAHTVYPASRCRFSSDIDLWVQSATSSRAIAALQLLGYTSHESELRPSAYKARFGGVCKLTGRSAEGRGLVELQWPAIRGEWVRLTTAIDHEGIWNRRVPLSIGESCASIMAPEDLLVHLSVHAAINHQFAIWLGALLDIHLLVTRTPDFDWQLLVERAAAWRVRPVLWAILSATCYLFGTDMPASVLPALAPSPLRRAIFGAVKPESWLLYEEGERHMNHRRFLIQFLLVERPRDAVRLVTHALFPPAEWLRVRYGTTTRRQLWRERLLHPLRVLLRAEV